MKFSLNYSSSSCLRVQLTCPLFSRIFSSMYFKQLLSIFCNVYHNHINESFKLSLSLANVLSFFPSLCIHYISEIISVYVCMFFETFLIFVSMWHQRLFILYNFIYQFFNVLSKRCLCFFTVFFFFITFSFSF